MDPLVSSAIATWSPNPLAIALLIVVALLYVRGWRLRRRLVVQSSDANELLYFLGGLFVLGLALESPLDALDGLFLSAHMTQHLLLLMVAPPLLLLGQPTVPLLRGLPRRLVRDGLGPFLNWPLLKRVGRWRTAMPLTFALFALSTLLWHIPRFYELALRSPGWHDAQHACFFWTGLLFWWPVILQRPAKRHWPEWTVIPYLLFSDIVNTALSAFFIFSGTILYPSYQRLPNGLLSPQDDQALAGAIMWVPGSIVYLLPAIVFAMRLLSPPGAATVSQPLRHRSRSAKLPKTHRLPTYRRAAQIVMLLLAIIVVVDGFGGSQIAPLNLAGVWPWVYWRALSIAALLTIGNLFCAACPFVLVRDLGRRVLPARLRWPRALRNKWLPVALLLLYFWAYEAFGLWDSPSRTSWIIVGYFAAALVIDGFFRGATFCKYVCPIGQFHFVTSLLSPREVTIRRPSVCESCRTYDCIKGNTHARGCELDLFQPRKESNLDCTFCLDCVKACPHDNVALLPVMPGETVLKNDYRSSLGRLANRTDYAALVLVVVFGAFVNAAGMIAPVMMIEHRWHRYGMPLAIGIFTLLGAVLLPAVLMGLFTAIARDASVVRRLVFTLVPIGAAMWAAHLLYHFVTVLAGGGMPSWLVPSQIVLLDAGVLWTLYLAWRMIKHRATILLPWSALAIALYAVGLWILLQPMAMRGMMHS